MPLWSGGLGHREDEEIACLQACQRSRRHGQYDRLALRRPDLHAMRGGINGSDGRPHGPLRILAPDVGGRLRGDPHRDGFPVPVARVIRGAKWVDIKFYIFTLSQNQ